MESKGLNIKSFYQNQKLLDAINNLLLYYKLNGKVADTGIDAETLQQSKSFLTTFLERLNTLVGKVEQHEEDPLTGADIRFRNFAKSFVEAKGKKTRFTSALFQSNIPSLKLMLEDSTNNSIQELIKSLSELRLLFEEQVSIDSKSIIGDI